MIDRIGELILHPVYGFGLVIAVHDAGFADPRADIISSM